MLLKQKNSGCKVKLCINNKVKTPKKGYITIFTCKPLKIEPNKKKCRKHHKGNKCRRIPCRPKLCKLKQPVRVIANQLDIRKLVPETDQVEIFGTDGTHLQPIRTDGAGRLEVVQGPVMNTIFREESFLNQKVTHLFTSLPLQNTAVRTVTSYAVINRGASPATIRIEISPNGQDFATDQQEVVVPNTMRVLVPIRFLKWTRFSARTDSPDHETCLDVYFQSQTVGT
ncbi:DUF6385 domain-containing protein [Paenibacillus rigui]|uniref:DUF6385 domain-containing protein n=1 Tax=Paenibacillus rigui TaxID=554312 RepID=A0A229UUV1_9BACL|nr:DUF6385 domain-containing protein [Paenibacillus rigui]OXM87387.1 hypothetical protein CF651_05295 [Paenibacillus rigui]